MSLSTLAVMPTDFTIVRHDGATRTYFTINIVTSAGITTLVNTETREPREFSTRSSARKAITRLRRSL